MTTTYHGSIDPGALTGDGNYEAFIVAVDASPNANERDTTPITLTVITGTVTPTIDSPGRPAIRYEIAFGQAPFTVAPVWTDVTANVLAQPSTRIQRGAPPDSPGPTAALLTFTLVDQERKYDPDNTASPYYGQLTSLCPCRVTGVYPGGVPQLLDADTPIDTDATLDGGIDGDTVVPLAYGYIKSFPQQYAPPEHADKYVAIPIEAPDALAILATTTFMPAQPFTWAPDEPPGGRLVDTIDLLDSSELLDGDADWPDYMRWDSGAVFADSLPDLPKERSGTRIYNRLLIAGIPADFLDIDEGHTIVEAGQPQEQYLLDHIRTITATEYGRFYQAADGTLRFVARTPGTVRLTSGTWTDRPGEMRWATLEYDPADTRLLVNRCRRSSRTVAEVLVQDQRSIDQNGVHEDQQALAFDDPEDALDQANYIVRRYKDAAGRVTGMTIKPDRDPTVMFPTVLNIDEGTIYAIERTPLGIGDPIVKIVTVEQFVHEFDYRDDATRGPAPSAVPWVTTCVLGEADTTPYLTWDDPELGVWDAGLVFAY